MEELPSGQRQLTVNQFSSSSQVRILSPPPFKGIFMQPNLYRKNVGIALRNKDGLFFAGQRYSRSLKINNWQMPQGGVDENEDLLSAMYRELSEETGITKDCVKVVAQYEKELFYDFPERGVYKGNDYTGQRQTWFLLDFIGQEDDINLNLDKEVEFSAYKWTDFDFLIENIVDFKRPIYIEIGEWVKKI